MNVLVTLDGKPLEGATVVLSSEGGGEAISGFTAADGTATLDSASKNGVPAGNYKVLVTKVKAVASGPIDPKDPDSMKKLMKGGGKGGKSELPPVYNDPNKTPLTLTIPSSGSPAKIELKSTL